MDQDAVVSEQIISGKRLIEALEADGFEVRIAFWATPTDDEKCYLYLASPVVEEQGPAAAYRSVNRVLRTTPNLWIEPLEVRLIGLSDSIAKAALAVTEPKVPDNPFAVQNAKPYPGMTRFGGCTLGGLSVDGAYIYPPSRPGTSASG